MPKLVLFFDENRFAIISWFVTFLIVTGLIGGVVLWRKSSASGQALVPRPTAATDEKRPQIPMPALGGPLAFLSIEREIQIKTNIPADKPRYDLVEYHVSLGDSIFAIAE